MIIGERLAELRKDKGLTQEDLGAILNVNYKTLSTYEREVATPPDKVKIAIAKYFNVSLDYLMGITREELPLDRKGYIVLPLNCSDEYINEVKYLVDLASYKYKLK